MVVMEHLRTEDGWTALSAVQRVDRGQQLQAAVQEILSKAHALHLLRANQRSHPVPYPRDINANK